MWCEIIERIIFIKYVRVSNVVDKTLLLLVVYAGVVLFIVPSIYCSSGSSRVLTYENIFNVTKYPQVQYQSRPFQTGNQHDLGNIQHKIKPSEEAAQAQANDVDYEFNEDGVNTIDNALLIGLSHDPFRISVPETEYIKDVRTPNPQYYKGDRGKRGVVHLYNMIYCATGCDPISYKGYGCYCGFLGAGRPMDGIDRCCQMHDHCYENIRCPFYTVYFQPYFWKCYHGQPLCALENYQTRQNYINGCAARLCECDRRFAMCLQRYRCPRGRALCTSQPLRLLQNLLMFP